MDLVDLVDLEDEPRPSEAQDHNEGPDAAGGKSDKVKRNWSDESRMESTTTVWFRFACS